jgi:hypothetical protein
VISKGCLVRGEVKSFTSFFSVPKGEGDVRIVYDGTKSGLNAQLWSPWFPLPTIETNLWSVNPGYYMGDIDFSKQFLNFMLHEKVRKYTGVDVAWGLSLLLILLFKAPFLQKKSSEVIILVKTIYFGGTTSL